MLGNIDHLITWDDDVRLMQGSSNRLGQRISHYNGSMWLCRSGARSHVSDDFTPERAISAREDLIAILGHEKPGSDQAWFSSALGPNERTYGPDDGVYQYHAIRREPQVPSDACMVFFAGNRKPWTPSVARHHPPLARAYMRDFTRSR